jgi:polar amino acid transport system substrate-binding protein
MAKPILGAILLCIACGAGAGCDLPQDAEGTLERVRGGTMRVGVSHNPPWVRIDGDRIAGIEPALLRLWAERLQARIEWVRASEADLVEALRAGVLDVVAGGLTSDTPWASRLGLSQPYLTTQIGFAVPPGTAAPGDWSGREVAVAAERIAMLALVRRESATPVASPAAGDNRPAAEAVYDFEIEARGLDAAGPTLAPSRRVIAVRPGESAFLLALDRFLQARDEAAMRRLAADEAAVP